MNYLGTSLRPEAARDSFAGAVARILQVQTRHGAIPWYEDGPWDPWNHTECAMALNVVGEREKAEQALLFLADTQNADGSWSCDYGNAVPMKDRLRMSREPAPQARDTNFSAYCAVGLLHHYACHGDRDFVRRMWPTVLRAMDFVISCQSPSGDIPWSAECIGDAATEDSLIAGNASIFKSLECASHLRDLVGDGSTCFEAPRNLLQSAFMTKPERFNRLKQPDPGFAMDWYYPVMVGLFSAEAAEERLRDGWTRFVDEGRGCRCVETEPWVTVAETCELSMALISIGHRKKAAQIYESQARYRDSDGAYWMGWQYHERIFWPLEQPSWTQAAAILAADALYGLSPASQLLIRHDTGTRRNILRL